MLTSSSEIDYSKPIPKFSKQLFQQLETFGFSNNPMALAAIFDLIISASYIQNSKNGNWKYCPNSNFEEGKTAVYPFVSCCPACLNKGTIFYIESNKPQSAIIGKSTSEALVALYHQISLKNNKDCKFYLIPGSAVVDAALTVDDKTILFEIKSSPLISFPMIAKSDPLYRTNEIGEDIAETNHEKHYMPSNVDVFLVFGDSLKINLGNFGKLKNGDHFGKILEWFSNIDNCRNYLHFWQSLYVGYIDKSKRTKYHWLTNGCGVPHPRPDDWPARATSGFLSISDGKNAVGMDRTDDLKKGIYQVLKISTNYKSKDSQNIYAALLSNIHAVRHHSDYISNLEDIVWANTKENIPTISDESITFNRHLVYNLFDGIINFTEPHFKDEFVKDILKIGK